MEVLDLTISWSSFWAGAGIGTVIVAATIIFANIASKRGWL